MDHKVVSHFNIFNIFYQLSSFSFHITPKPGPRFYQNTHCKADVLTQFCTYTFTVSCCFSFPVGFFTCQLCGLGRGVRVKEPLLHKAPYTNTFDQKASL